MRKLLAVLGALVFGWVSLADAQPKIRYGPILTPCHQSAGISDTEGCLQIWTDVPAEVYVKYGPSPLQTGGDLWTVPTQGAADQPANLGGYKHVHKLVSLAVGSSVEYEIWLNGAPALKSNGQAHRYQFTALGSLDFPIHFGHLGDWTNKASTSGGTASEPFDTWMTRFQALGVYGIITAGDNSYYVLEKWFGSDGIGRRLFEALQPLSGTTWMMPTAGNHDNSSIYKSVYPGNFRLHIGPLTFISMTTCGSCGSDTTKQSQLRTWIREGKARNNIVVVSQHYPNFPCSYYDDVTERMILGWVPIYETEGVSLVLQGHEHGYAESLPKNGVTYVTAGGGSDGSGQSDLGWCSTLEPGKPYSSYPQFRRTLSRIKQMGVLSVLDANTVQWAAYRMDGTTVNAPLVFTRQGTPPPNPPAPIITLTHAAAWVSQHAEQGCTLDGQPQPASASVAVEPGAHTLTCTGAGGSTTKTFTIQVGAP